MKKVISLALLAGGSRLTIFGASAYASARSNLYQRIPVSSTDKAKWMLIGGVAITVVGLVGLLRSTRAD